MKRLTTSLLLVLIVLLALMIPGATLQAQEATPEIITYDPDTGQFEIPVTVDDTGWFEMLVANPWFFAFACFGSLAMLFTYQHNQIVKDALSKLYTSVPQPFQEPFKDAIVAGVSAGMMGLGGATQKIPGELDDQIYDLIKRTTLETLKELFADETIQYRFPTAPKPFAIPPDDGEPKG